MVDEVAADEVVRDGLAAADAGAAILHLHHAYNLASGRQRDDAASAIDREAGTGPMAGPA